MCSCSTCDLFSRDANVPLEIDAEKLLKVASNSAHSADLMDIARRLINRGKVFLPRKDCEVLEAVVNQAILDSPEVITEMEKVFSIMMFTGRDVTIPANYRDIAKNAQANEWLKAVQEEMDSLEKNKTWEYVVQPDGRKVIDSRWVFQLKLNPDGSVKRFKARFVVKGYTQIYGLDYTETFAPVVGMVSLRMMLAFAVGKGWFTYSSNGCRNCFSK